MGASLYESLPHHSLRTQVQGDKICTNGSNGGLEATCPRELILAVKSMDTARDMLSYKSHDPYGIPVLWFPTS